MCAPFLRAQRLKWTGIARYAFWATLSLFFCWLLTVSWMRGMELLIDFGRELYLPWRVTLGEHLGRDYVHPYGPFAVYFNAGLFAVFGVSVRTLVIANLVVFAVLAVLSFRLLRRAFGYLPATVAMFVAVPVFGFPHLADVGNYSFATPYSHEATHGMALLVILLTWLGRPAVPRGRNGIIAGMLAALVCLTKSEYVLTTALILGLVGMRFAVDPAWRGRCLRWSAGFAAGALVVFVATWIALALQTDSRVAALTTFNAVLAPWAFRTYSHSPHVLHYLGADEPLRNLARIGAWGGLSLAALITVGWLIRWLPLRSNRAVTISVFVGIGLGVFVALQRIPPDECGYAFPLLLLAGAWHTARAWRRALDQGRPLPARIWVRSLFLVAACAMMARMALAPTIAHYGFFQAMLAALWLSSFLVGEWSTLAAHTHVQRRAAAVLAAIVILLTAGVLTRRSIGVYRLKQTPVGEGADRVYTFDWDTYPRHFLWDHARKYIVANTASDSTLLVLPEGVSLNYLARRKHPLRILDALPATLPMNSLDVVEQLGRNPPETVVLVRRDGSEILGFRDYGATDATGKRIVDWVLRNYTPVIRAGEYPFSQSGFGLWVLRLNHATPPA